MNIEEKISIKQTFTYIDIKNNNIADIATKKYIEILSIVSPKYKKRANYKN